MNYLAQPTTFDPEFFEIPGYSRYAISKYGKVITKKNLLAVAGSKNPAGYHNFRLVGDDGRILTWGRHRLMAYVFLYPGDITNLVANHRNGIKGDDRLDNLEWVTQQGNVEHAGLTGLTTKCLPISVRDVDTGDVVLYPSAIEYARQTGMSKDAILYRLKEGSHRVFPERKQYRIGHTGEAWNVPKDVEKALLLNTTSKTVLVRNVLTGEVLMFPKLGAAATFLGVSASTMTSWTNNINQPVVPGFYQIKMAHSVLPWREITDPYCELEAFTKNRCVKVVNDKTWETTVYVTAKKCAEAMGLTPTALNNRLHSGGLWVFKDGYRYSYYTSA